MMALPLRTSRSRRPGVRAKCPVLKFDLQCTWSTARFLRGSRRAADHRNEYIGNARCVHVAELLELHTIRALEEQRAAAEDLPLMDRLERPRRGQAVGMHRH